MQNTKPRTRKIGKFFFLFFLLSSFFFRRASSMLNMRTSHGGLRMKEQHFIWSSSNPIAFHNIEVLPGAWNYYLKTMASSLGPIFLKITEQRLQIIIQDRWIRNTVGVPCTWAWIKESVYGLCCYAIKWETEGLHAFWMPGSMFRQAELALSSIQRRVNLVVLNMLFTASMVGI